MIRVLNIVALVMGGTGISVMNYYRHINRENVQFDFLSAKEVEEANRIEATSLGAKIYHRPLFKQNPIENILALYRVYRQNPEIKVAHLQCDNSMKAVKDMLIAKIAGIPVRIVYSDNDIRDKRLLGHTLSKPLVRALATHYLAASIGAGLSMFGESVISKTTVLPRARDLDLLRYNPEKRDELRKKLSLGSELVFINVGRLTNQKNHFFLFEVFAQALKCNPTIVLLLAGDGELKEDLIEKAAELEIQNNVRFLGNRDDVPELLQAADVFVLPSLYEGMPGAAIEAQAAGLPCLLADTISKDTKVIDSVEFLPIDKRPEIWVERMFSYEKFNRRDTRNEMSKAGYDISDAAKKLEEFYLTAVEGR